MKVKSFHHIDKKIFDRYFCDAYIKTLRPSERAYFNKHLITWNKMMRLIKENYLLLADNPACIRLYNDFWDNLFAIAANEKTPIEYLGISTGAYNCLKRMNLIYIEDIVSDYSKVDDLIKIRKIGEKTAKEITLKLREYQLEKKQELDDCILHNNKDYHLLWDQRQEIFDVIKKNN